jgi:hypothetical protein
MLFDSTVRKELARSFGATLMVLLTIVLTNFLIRTLGLAANGAVSPQDVVLVLGFFALGNLPTVLALSLFVGIVLSLGRMYRESEMAIWFSSGVGLMRFVRPVHPYELARADRDRGPDARGLALDEPAVERHPRRLCANAPTCCARRRASSRPRPTASACSSSRRRATSERAAAATSSS